MLQSDCQNCRLCEHGRWFRKSVSFLQLLPLVKFELYQGTCTSDLFTAFDLLKSTHHWKMTNVICHCDDRQKNTYIHELYLISWYIHLLQVSVRKFLFTVSFLWHFFVKRNCLFGYFYDFPFLFLFCARFKAVWGLSICKVVQWQEKACLSPSEFSFLLSLCRIC